MKGDQTNYEHWKTEDKYRVSQNYVNTNGLMDTNGLGQNTDCGIIYSPRNVCPGFKWYCCWLVIEC
jgi:hypothetical protein